MRLATLRDGTKDGALCVVNKALTLFCKATEIANSLQQAIDHRIERAIDLLGAAKRGDGALLYSPGLVTVGLDELDVATGTGGGDLDVHAATLTRHKASSSLTVTVTNVPPQHFCDHGLETRAGAGGTFPKGAKIGVKCRTPVHGPILRRSGASREHRRMGARRRWSRSAPLHSRLAALLHGRGACWGVGAPA